MGEVDKVIRNRGTHREKVSRDINETDRCSWIELLLFQMLNTKIPQELVCYIGDKRFGVVSTFKEDDSFEEKMKLFYYYL